MKLYRSQSHQNRRSAGSRAAFLWPIGLGLIAITMPLIPLSSRDSAAASAAASTVAFGQTSATNAVASQAGAGYRFGSVVLPTQNGTVTAFSVYVSGASSAQTLTPAVYGTSGGQPTNLLGVGTAITVAAYQRAGWVSTPISVKVTAGMPVLLSLLAGSPSATAYEYSRPATGTGLWAHNSAGNTSPDTQFGIANVENKQWLFNVTESTSTPTTTSSRPTTIPLPVTLGQTSTSNAVASQAGAGYRFGSAVTPAQTGTVTAFSTYVSGGNSAQVLTPAIYATSAGQPTNLVGVGTAITVAADQPAGWVSTPISVPVTAGTPIVLSVLAGSQSATASEYSRATPSAGVWAHNDGGNTTPDPQFQRIVNETGLVNVENKEWLFKVTEKPTTTVPTTSTPPTTQNPPVVSSCAQASTLTTSSIPGYTFKNAEDFRTLASLPSDWGVYSGVNATSYFAPSHVGIMNDGRHGQALYIKGYPDGHGLPITTGGLQDTFNATSGGFSTCLDFDTLNTTKGATGVKVVVMSWTSDNQWPQHGEVDALEGNNGHWDAAVVIGSASQYPTSNGNNTGGFYNLNNGSAWAPIVYPVVDSSTAVLVTVLWDPVNGVRIYYGTKLIDQVAPSTAPGGWYPAAYGSSGRNIAIQTELVAGDLLAGTTADARIYWVTRYNYTG